MDRINEATKERDLATKVEELNELVVELTTRLNQGESQIRSVERVCTFRAADFHTQLHRLQGNVDNQSTSTINPECSPSREPTGPDSHESVHPSLVRREGGTPPPVSTLWTPCRDSLAPPTPTTPVDWGFCDPNAHLCCSPRCVDVPSNLRNTSTTSTSSRGESGLLRKLILKRLVDLNNITSKVVDDDTELEKVKVLHTRTVPKVEKAVRELENTLQQYSRICDPIDLDDLSD